MQSIYLTGGSGLLGSEILKLAPSITAPLAKKVDITNYDSIVASFKKNKPSIVIHLAAITSPRQHDANPEPGIRTNIMGTCNVALACLKLKLRLVYASSDYLYRGPGPHKEDESVGALSNFYLSKLGGECAVRMIPNALVLRLSFGSRPFPYDQVYADQWNSKLYVDEMAPLVLSAAVSNYVGIMNIGGPRTSLEEYAKRTRPDITTIPRPAWVPQDVSLDLAVMKKILSISDESHLYKH